MIDLAQPLLIDPDGLSMDLGGLSIDQGVLLIDQGNADRPRSVDRPRVFLREENTTTDILPYNYEACGCRNSQWQKIVLLNSDILVKYLRET